MSIVREIGHFLKKNIKPNLHPSKEQKHLESIVLGSSLLKTIGDVLVKYYGKKSGKGINSGSGKILTQEGLNILESNIKNFSKKLPIKGSGKSLKHILKQSNSEKISAEDVFGKNWQEKSKELVRKIKELHKQKKGGNIFKNIGHAFTSASHSIEHGFSEIGKVSKEAYNKAKKARDAAIHELSQFAQGKTAFKPSKLANYLAASVGAVGAISAFVPGIDLISVPMASAAALGLKSASLALKTSGRGLTPSARKFAKKHPNKAREIIRLLDTGYKGGKLSKRTKNILKIVGASGLTGALGFLGWAMNRDTDIVIPQIDHTLPDDAWLGLGSKGEGFSDIIKFLKKHKKKALAILLGVAVVGTAIAGQALFKEKYGGIALNSSNGRAIIKHLLSNSGKKLDMGNVVLKGRKVVHFGEGIHLAGYGLKPSGGSLKPAGGALKLSKKVKTALKYAGALSIPLAIGFAKWYANNGNIDVDDWGSVSASEHLELYGDGLTWKFPNKYKKFVKKYPHKAKQIIKELDKNRGKPIRKTKRRKIGSKKEVYENLAEKTSGGLLKCHLCRNKRGKVVSIKQMENGKKRIQNLRGKKLK
jgi:hypothetical protein